MPPHSFSRRRIADTSVTVWQGEFELLPPDPWDGQAPDPPVGAMRPQVVETEGQRGRRAGSTNKRAEDLTSEDLTSYVARRYGSPLEHLAQLVATPIDELAREMRVRPLVAAKFHSRMASLLAHYTLAATPKPVVIGARDGASQWAQMHYDAASAASEPHAVGVVGLPPGEMSRTKPADPLAIATAGLPPKGKD